MFTDVCTQIDEQRGIADYNCWPPNALANSRLFGGTPAGRHSASPSSAASAWQTGSCEFRLGAMKRARDGVPEIFPCAALPFWRPRGKMPHGGVFSRNDREPNDENTVRMNSCVPGTPIL